MPLSTLNVGTVPCHGAVLDFLRDERRHSESTRIDRAPACLVAKTPITATRFQGYDRVAEQQAPTVAAKSNAAALFQRLNKKKYQPEQLTAECFGKRSAQVAVAEPAAQVIFLQAKFKGLATVQLMREWLHRPETFFGGLNRIPSLLCRCQIHLRKH